MTIINRHRVVLTDNEIVSVDVANHKREIMVDGQILRMYVYLKQAKNGRMKEVLSIKPLCEKTVRRVLAEDALKPDP